MHSDWRRISHACSVPAAVLGLHPGHADKPGQHDAGPHPLHAADVRRHGTRRHGDGRQRAGGLPAEEGQGASADGVCRRLQAPQIQLMMDRTSVIWRCIHVPWEIWENPVLLSCWEEVLQSWGDPAEFLPACQNGLSFLYECIIYEDHSSERFGFQNKSTTTTQTPVHSDDAETGN